MSEQNFNENTLLEFNGFTCTNDNGNNKFLVNALGWAVAPLVGVGVGALVGYVAGRGRSHDNWRDYIRYVIVENPMTYYYRRLTADRDLLMFLRELSVEGNNPVGLDLEEMKNSSRVMHSIMGEYETWHSIVYRYIDNVRYHAGICTCPGVEMQDTFGLVCRYCQGTLDFIDIGFFAPLNLFSLEWMIYEEPVQGNPVPYDDGVWDKEDSGNESADDDDIIVDQINPIERERRLNQMDGIFRYDREYRDIEVHERIFNRNSLLTINASVVNSLPLYAKSLVDNWFIKINPVSQNEYTTEFMDWGLTAVSLADNPSPVNFLVSFLRHINRIFGMQIISNIFVKYIGMAFEAVRGVVQPILAPISHSFSRNNLEWISKGSEVMKTLMDVLASMGDSVETIVSVMAATVVSCTLFLLGKSTLAAPLPLLTKLGKMGMSVAGVQRGIDAAMCMIGQLQAWIMETVGYVVSVSMKDSLMAAVVSFPLQDTDTFQKSKVFEYIDYLCHPKNTDEISSSAEKRDLLENTLSLVTGLLRENAVNRSFDSRCEKLLWESSKELLKVRETSFRYTTLDSTRMTPFWVNIVGPAGVGKSTIMTKMLNNILNVLATDAKYAVPATNAQRIFPVNFTDKYLVGYAQQYAMTVDDIFQDSCGQLDISSALSMITWVSSVPHRTVQADIKSKGSPYNTKMIFTTSNMLNPIRSEIQCQGALLDRMRVVLKIEFHPDVCDQCRRRGAILCKDCTDLVDPLYGLPVVIKRQRLNAAKTRFEEGETLTMNQVYRTILREYCEWFDKEHNLMTLSKGDEVLVNQLATEIFERNARVVCCEDVLYSLDEKVSTIGYTCYDWCSQWWNFLQYKPTRKTEVSLEGRCEILYLLCDDDAVNELFIRDFFSGGTTVTHIVKWLQSRRGLPISTRASLFNQAMERAKQTITSSALWGALGTFAVIVLGWHAYKGYNCPTNHQDPFNVRYSNSQPQRSGQKRGLFRRNHGKQFFDSSVDPQTTSIIESMQNNASIVRVDCEIAVGRVSTCVALRPRGRWLMLNKHAVRQWNAGSIIRVVLNYKGGTKVVQQCFDPTRIKEVSGRDLCFYECDAAMPNARDITDHFVDDEGEIGITAARIITAQPMPMVIPNLIAENVLEEIGDIDQGDKVNVLMKLWSVNYNMVKGQSGSVLLADNTRWRRKILGFHIGSTGARSFFEPLVRSEILEMTTSGIDLPVECGDTVDNNFGRNALIHIGKTDRPVTQSSKTKIVASAIQREDWVSRFPAVLHGKDARLDPDKYGCDILKMNLKAYDKPTGVISMMIYTLALSIIRAKYFVMEYVGIPRRILTDFEMVNGVSPHLQPLDMHTSPGYPWLHQRTNNGHGKFEWFEETIHHNGLKTYTMKDKLAKVVTHREQLAREGKRVESYSYACLKDETRLPEKISSGKTRIFLCMPMDFNLLVRKYFGAFVAAMHAKAGKMSACVGIDPATGWTDLVMRLRRVGERFEDFDYSGWDTCLHPQLFQAFVDVVNGWYSDGAENARVREILIHELVYNYIIARDDIYLKTAGTTSGCAITAELNSFIHDFLNVYYYCVISLDRGDEPNGDDFYANVETAVYGDDSIKNVSSKFMWFSGSAIRPISKQLGMDITPGDKSDQDFRFKTLSEITFLKRSFREDGLVIRAPLQFNIIRDITQWVTKSDDVWAATRLNCDVALRECAQYGSTKFEEFREDLLREFMRINSELGVEVLRPLCNSYEYYIKSINSELSFVDV